MSSRINNIFQSLVLLVRHAGKGIFIAGLLIADPAMSAAVSGVSVGDDIAIAATSQFPGSKIARSRDFDKEECGSAVGNPGLVEADFNGDGFKDFAVLLIGKTKQIVEWQGKNLKLMEVKLVAFLKNDQGRFQSFLIERMDEYYPLSLKIELQTPGEIQEFLPSSEARSVKLKHPSILRHFCGKSSGVFYWDEKKKNFQQIPTGD